LGSGVGFGTQDGGLSHAEGSAGHGNRPFLLFNSTAADRREVVEVTVWDNGPAGAVSMRSRSYRVQSPDGSVVPAQVTGGGAYWGHDYATVAFPASVPGLGYAVYTVIEDEAPATPSDELAGAVKLTGAVHHCRYSFYERSSEGIENDLVRVDVNPATGGILRLLHKGSGIELVTPDCQAPALEYEVERPHGMSAWLVQHPGTPPEYPQLRDLRRGQSGPYRATIEVDLCIHESDFTVTYELRAGDPKVYVHVKGTWFQRGTKETGVPAICFKLPLALENAHGCYEIPFGAIDRATTRREEVPSQQWAQASGQISGQEAGCLLLNDCKYGHSLEGNALRLTLIRSSYEPDILPEIGRHEVHMAIYPFVGVTPVPAAIRMGQEFNRALRIVGTDVHDGRLPLTGQFVHLAAGDAVLTGIKQAEDDARLVLRLFNPTDKRATARLDFGHGAALPSPRAAEELDLLERPIKNGAVTLKGKVVSVSLPAGGIVTVALRF
jgi:alpha-mannosidase